MGGLWHRRRGRGKISALVACGPAHRQARGGGLLTLRNVHKMEGSEDIQTSQMKSFPFSAVQRLKTHGYGYGDNSLEIWRMWNGPVRGIAFAFYFLCWGV